MPISLAYSPDTDDAFMMAALEQKLIPWGPYQFTFIRADIEELNQAARQGRYDITAISIAAYPALAEHYLFMPIGCSVGDGYGPAIVVRDDSSLKHPQDLAGRRVAVPGRATSAFAVANGMLGPFEPVFLRFDQIADAVQRQEVDAGILIHELQMDVAFIGLRKIGNLGTEWQSRFGLPLPLGANAIRRSLGNIHIKALTETMRRSIAYGLEHRQSTLSYAIQQSKPDLSMADGDRYISMYVNQDSLEISAPLRQGIEQVFKFSCAAAAEPSLPSTQFLMDGLYA